MQHPRYNFRDTARQALENGSFCRYASGMQVKLKLQYESYLGPYVRDYIDAAKVPRKGDVLDLGGVSVEVRHVMKTPFSKFHAAIVYVKAVEFLAR